MPTSNCGGIGILAVCFRISLSTPGAILQPQPPPCDREVRRGPSGAGAIRVIEVSPGRPASIPATHLAGLIRVPETLPQDHADTDPPIVPSPADRRPAGQHHLGCLCAGTA